MAAKKTAGGGDDKLGTYRKKRDFSHTPEPSGDARATPGGAELRFVVQKHAARREHYDFRLELDGVLKSWAVPKGPTLDPAEKRLAVETEDHPIEYGDFEGVIPAGEYGGGTVLLWDRGRWIPDGDAAEKYAEGRLSFRLEGEKLRGSFSLVRLPKKDAKPGWLLMKKADDEAVPRSGAKLLEERPESVLSERDIEAIARDPGRVWHSNQSTEDNVRAAAPPLEAPKKAAPKTPKKTGPVTVAGMKISNPERVLYEEQGITKGQIAEWYGLVADAMLPHVQDRPLMLVRCPEGTKAGCFHQKHAGRQLGGGVLARDLEDGGVVKPAILVNTPLGVASFGQYGVLEVHTWGSRFGEDEALVERPDILVFDLDPAEDVPWDRVIAAAHDVRGLLERIGLESFVKLTGGKGLHVTVPVKPTLAFEQAKDFSRGVAQTLVAEFPAKYVATMTKTRRKGRVFVDFFRNGRGATFVAPFSPRARPHAPVALPVRWAELEEVPAADAFTIATPAERVERARRAWEELHRVQQSIDVGVIERLQAIAAGREPSRARR